jgi:cysteine-S-conjugate beta-lyase
MASNGPPLPNPPGIVSPSPFGKLGKELQLDLDGNDLPPSPASSTPRGERRRYALATELVYTEGTDQYNSSSMPIYQVSGTWEGDAMLTFTDGNL